jgi:hypothetical protein
MRKIIFLLVAVLGVSGVAFGQKEGRVLWEKEIDTKLRGLNNGLNWLTDEPIISSSGNVLIKHGFYYNTYPDNLQNGNDAKAFDRDGKLLWKVNDYYKNTSAYVFADTRNKNYTLLNCDKKENYQRDSVFLFDKDFIFKRSFDTHTNNAFLVSVDEGVFYNTPQKTLIKYDANGSEQWRFDHKDPINILSSKPPYFGLVFTPNDEKPIFIFDKNGRKKGETSPQTFNKIYPTSDNGFWLSTSSDFKKDELIKYDSTGKQTAKISRGNLLPPSPIYSNSRIESTPDNSLLIMFFNENKEICFTKIDKNGGISKVVRNVGIKEDFEANANENLYYFITISDFKIASDGSLLYGIIYTYTSKGNTNFPKVYGGIVGAEKFNDANFGWFKTEKSEVSFPITNFSSGTDDIIEFTSKYYTDRVGNFIGGKISYYELDGKLKWSYRDVWIREFLRKGNEVYVTKAFSTQLNILYVFDYNTGKIIRQKDNFFVNNLKSDIKIDELGNVHIIYFGIDGTVNGNQQKYIITKKDGTDLWQYKNPIFNSFIWTGFQVTGSGGIVAGYIDYTANTMKYGLRKISPCNDLNAISISGNAEACPTEKVKLSVPKQDGITYQWQKDGKDIPNTKDVVYDFGESGTYTVIAKDELCQNTVTSNALKINIRNLPTAEITAPKSIFCDGEKTTIASKTNGTFFQWQKDGKDIPNATSGIYEVSQAGDYRVGVRDDKCPQVGYSNIYTIITKLLPEATISTDIKGVVYEPFTVKMTANTGTGFAYQWLKDDAIIPDENKATYEAQKSGKYKVNVTYDGCTKLSDALTISILIPLANQEEVGEEVVQVYPNPSKGEFRIILPKSLKSADVQLFDTFGRERSLVYVGEQAQAEGLGQGVYFLRVQKGEKSVTSKLIID